MKVVSFIETHQRDVIEKILRHCGLWEGPLRTLANPRAPPKRGTRPDGDEPRELQLVLDPEAQQSEGISSSKSQLIRTNPAKKRHSSPCEARPSISEPQIRDPASRVSPADAQTEKQTG